MGSSEPWLCLIISIFSVPCIQQVYNKPTRVQGGSGHPRPERVGVTEPWGNALEPSCPGTPPDVSLSGENHLLCLLKAWCIYQALSPGGTTPLGLWCILSNFRAFIKEAVNPNLTGTSTVFSATCSFLFLSVSRFMLSCQRSFGD